MKLKMMMAAAVTLTLLAGCDPKSGDKQVPGVNAPFPVLYVLGDVYNDKRQPMKGIPVEVRGTIMGVDSGATQPVGVSPGCRPAAKDAMICDSPDLQIVDMTGVRSFTFHYRFLTNIPGWSVGCLISTVRTGAAGIQDQERSDRTSANHNEVLATCSFP